MNSNNRAELNPRIINQVVSRPRTQNPRFLYLNQTAIQSVPNNISNATVIQTSQPINQNSITNKLCKFFKNLLELEREQGRYKESVAVIQKYINKEINIDELGVQLKGNATKATLPDSLMTSLNSNIDDLRREMFYGRVKIDGINPPPETILDLNQQPGPAIISSNSLLTTTGPGGTTISVRLPTSQIVTPRPVSFPTQSSVVVNRPPMQPQSITNQSSLSLSSTATVVGLNTVSISSSNFSSTSTQPVNRPANQITRQLRPATISNSISNPSIFASQPLLNVSNNTATIAAPAPTTNLRTIAPSSPIRPSFAPNAVPTNQIRAVAVSTTALANNSNINTNKSITPVINNIASNQSINTSISTDELKVEAGIDQSVKQSIDCNQSMNNSGTAINNSNSSVSLPTNILNQSNYRNKIIEFSKSEINNNNSNNTSNNNVSNIGLTITDEALNYVSEAMENFCLSLLEQAAVFACHRQKLFKDDPIYREIDNVRSQMKFLQDLEEYQRASEEEKQKAELFKQAKSRSKMDNQEQQKIKETVRKIQEHDKNCDEYSRANMTALKAIGSKRKIIGDSLPLGTGGVGAGGTMVVDEMSGATVTGGAIAVGGMQTGGAMSVGGPLLAVGGTGVKQARFVNSIVTGGPGATGTFSAHPPGSQILINQGFITGKAVPARTATVSRFRNKRIILKDFQLVLDQDVKLKRFKTYKKIFSYGRY